MTFARLTISALRWPVRAIAPLLATLVAAGACGRDQAAQASTPEPKIVEASDTSLVLVTHPERFPLVVVALRAVADNLGGTCTVSPDVNRVVPVNALGGGRVVELKASLGDRVQQGQTLVTISSPDLSNALGDHLKAAADEALAHKQLDRARLLFEHGGIAKKDLEVAEAAEGKAAVDLRTTAERVRMLGGDSAHPTPLIDLKAPIAGTIIEQSVTPTAGVKSPDNAPNLFTIADLSHVWVLCDLHENDLPRVRMGEVARIRLDAYPDRVLGGRVSNISQVLDSNTRTARVRIEIDNSGGFMRPGMFAVAEFESGNRENRPVLPTTTIMQLHDADWVFVKVGPASFRRVRVQGGREIAPGLQEILQGVSRGQEVVRDALQFVQASEQQ